MEAKKLRYSIFLCGMAKLRPAISNDFWESLKMMI